MRQRITGYPGSRRRGLRGTVIEGGGKGLKPCMYKYTVVFAPGYYYNIKIAVSCNLRYGDFLLLFTAAFLSKIKLFVSFLLVIVQNLKM